MITERIKKFIHEISRRFPDSDIETLEDAINRIMGTEYEYIFSEEITALIAHKGKECE